MSSGKSQSEIWEAWLEAGKVLAENAELKVACPVCGHEFLSVKDVLIDAGTGKIERHMLCKNCDATNSILLTDSKYKS